MAGKTVYSVCGMCSVRCPIQAHVEDGVCTFLQGNPFVAGIDGAICARGGAGLALVNDDERPRGPLIRDGERGEGKWRAVEWEEALEYVADNLRNIVETHGARSILFSDRSGPFKDLHQAFVRGLGSPNYCNHDVSCAMNVNHAAMSVFGIGRKEFIYDYRNARHVVLQTRNIFESINVKEVNDLMAGMEQGCKLTVIDIRGTVTASKADKFLMIRPGTDYAFNLAVIHLLLKYSLHDESFVRQWIKDFDRLDEFVKPYTPEWAERETGISAAEIISLVYDLAKASPSVVWHPGWMTARYRDSFHVCRSIYLINALLGTIGARGGMAMGNKPADVGRKGLKKLVDLVPPVTERRVDGAGWRYPHLGSEAGHLGFAFKALETGDPYPLKAYIAYRHDPLMAFPDPEALKSLFRRLDFMVSVTFSWSETAWFSDVVLPLSPYLERESIVACKDGLKPYFFTRERTLEPRFDTRADWEILCGLAGKLGMAQLAFDSIGAIRAYQLKGTGVSEEDFTSTGIVLLSEKALYRKRDELAFSTPSGKIEIICENLESQGLASLKPYGPPKGMVEGSFRIAFGRCAVHTQGHTVNNPILNELMPTNTLWLAKSAGEKMGLKNGDMVEVSGGSYSGRIKVHLTEFIHPEAAFLVHGFGHRLPTESRAFDKGILDNNLMAGGLDILDPAGGGLAMQEHFITIRKAS